MPTHELPTQLGVLLVEAAIHHNLDARSLSQSGRLIVDHAFLQPEVRDLQSDDIVDDTWNKLRSAEDIHQIDLANCLTRIVEGRIADLAENFLALAE